LLIRTDLTKIYSYNPITDAPLWVSYTGTASMLFL
jgi:hypothetical protein